MITNRNASNRSRSLHFSEVQVERPFDPEAVVSVLSSIAALTSRGPIVWEVRARGGEIRYLLGTVGWSEGRVKEAFTAHLKAEFLDDARRTPVTMAKKLKISHPVLSLNTAVSATMIRATLSSMVNTRSDTEVVLQIILGAPHAPRAIPSDLPDPTVSWIKTVLGHVPPATSEQKRSAREKAELPRLEAEIRLGASEDRSSTRLMNIVSSMRTLEAAGVRIHAEDEAPEKLNGAVIPFKMPLLLSVKELASLLLLPAGEEELPGAPELHPKTVPPPKWYKGPTSSYDNRTFAMSLGANPVGLSISTKDSLEHSVLASPTGSGKSTVLLHLALADIKAGRSVLLVDPKGDLAADVCARIPEERLSDVVVIDPSDPCPVGFNPLKLGSDPNLTADAILSVFQEIFSDSWGVRTAEFLTGALLTLTRVKDANLMWLEPLLTNPAFRKKVLSKVYDPVALTPFWRYYDEMRDSERRTEIAPVLRKLRQFQFRPAMRNVLGQTDPKFSLSQLFTSRKIVLVSLNRALVGAETAKLIGSLIVGLTWVLALSRAAVAPEKRHPVSVIIDELQDYIALPTSFSDALAQGRGLGIGFSVAFQYRGQLPPDIKAGVDANCRNKICFTLQAADAKDMAAEAPRLTAEDFMSLPRYQIYTNFLVGGKATGWISGKTLPPPRPVRLAAEAKALSMQRYGIPAEEVEKSLMELYSDGPAVAPGVADKPIGRKKIDEEGGEK